MKVTDLRIGNYIYYNNEIIKIIGIKGNKIYKIKVMKQLTEKELKKIYNGNVMAIPSNPFPLFIRFPQEVRYLIFDSLNMYSRMGKARYVSLEGLPKGTYFISWKSNEKNIILKFKK